LVVCLWCRTWLADILDGNYTGEKDVIVDIPSFTDDEVDKYVREDLSDSFWGQTRMTEEQIVSLYGNGKDGSQGISPVLALIQITNYHYPNECFMF
jgi:hypothetical protein